MLLTAEALRRREKILFCRKARKNAQNLKTIIKLFFALFAFFAAKDILKFSLRLRASAV
jgi:hypothetical protein